MGGPRLGEQKVFSSSGGGVGDGPVLQPRSKPEDKKYKVPNRKTKCPKVSQMRQLSKKFPVTASLTDSISAGSETA